MSYADIGLDVIAGSLPTQDVAVKEIVSGGISDTVADAWPLFSVAGVGMGAYHGYRRNDSVGWAIGWGLLGGLFPFITIPVSLAQGFGKKA